MFTLPNGLIATIMPLTESETKQMRRAYEHANLLCQHELDSYLACIILTITAKDGPISFVYMLSSMEMRDLQIKRIENKLKAGVWQALESAWFAVYNNATYHSEGPAAGSFMSLRYAAQYNTRPRIAALLMPPQNIPTI